MSVAIPYQFTTTASTNLQPVRSGGAGTLKSAIIVNTTAVINYLKLYWTGPLNTPVVVGTTVPTYTIAIPASVGIQFDFGTDGVTSNGQLWAAVTANPQASDATASQVGILITLGVE